MSNFDVKRRGEGRRFALVDGTVVPRDQTSDLRVTLEVMAQSDLLEALYYELEPGATTGDHADHDGQEIHMVLAGSVAFTVGSETVEVEAGDVVWHRSETDHAVKNVGDTRATVFLVNLPASFKF